MEKTRTSIHHSPFTIDYSRLFAGLDCLRAGGGCGLEQFGLAGLRGEGGRGGRGRRRRGGLGLLVRLVQAQARADEALDFLFDELAVDDPGFFRQHVAGLAELRGLKEDVVGRAPAARVARRLAVVEVSRLVARLARFGLGDEGVGRAALAEEGDGVGRRRVLADADALQARALVLLVELGRDRGLVPPVAAPGREVDDEDQLLALREGAQV